jgi:hypothetical protein
VKSRKFFDPDPKAIERGIEMLRQSGEMVSPAGDYLWGV